jgi:ABC-2 type transport system ATP-binding protein
VLVAYGAVWLLAQWRADGAGAGREVPVEIVRVEVPTSPDDPTPIAIDASLRLPDGASADRPVPAVLLLHGFGSDRRSQDARAESLVRRGYAVLAPSARGFGESGGEITLADRDREGRDLIALVDLLATRDEVLRDAVGDPRVALVGTSYGGGLALIGGALDPRVDAVVAITAWYDLAAALAPNAVGSPSSGPLKIGWTSLLFTARTLPGGLDAALGAAMSGPMSGAMSGQADPGAAMPVTPVTAERCGRFAPEICALADRSAVDGALDADAQAVLARASLAALPARAVPTLLVQGRDDTLFGVDAALANALALDAAGAPVRVRLAAGGHGAVGASATSGALAAEVDAWLDRWLALDGSDGGPDGDAEDATGTARSGVLVHDAGRTLETLAWPDVVRSDGTRELALVLGDAAAPGAPGAPGGLLVDGRPAAAGPAVAALFTPAGGVPAALTSIPGLGPVGQLAGLAGIGSVVDVPGQHVAFTSRPAEEATLLVGPATLTLDVAAESGEAQLFVRLATVAPGGLTTIIGSSFAPVRLERVSSDPAAPTRVGITLPDIVHRIEPGERLRLTIATTDQAFANLRRPGSVTIGLDAARLTLRGPGLAPAATDAVPVGASVASRAGLAAVWDEAPVAVLLVVVLAVGSIAAAVIGRVRRVRRTPLAPVAERLARTAAGAPPVVLRGLVKEYADGTRAVDGLDLTVEAGQVVGLLGPNGAGKTTTLRMLLGLIAPTAGTVELFGERMRPGHPVLERVGALVEGPGLVPDLSGRDNLELFWRTGGRPLAEADLDWAMSVADLGSAIDRPVRTYSHGMEQRLAIAQALLGRPELLVLDEPTDGLDPEQIRAMRRLLVRLGAEGHTVLVSSHLLAEVEQTCTHAVVVLGGRVVAYGPVSELGARGRTLVVEVDDRDRARAVLADVDGVDDVALEGAGLVVTLDDPGRSADVVATLVGAGLRVTTASRRGRLEDAFLQLTGADAEASA